MNFWLRQRQRWRYPKSMRHMADLHPDFIIETAGDSRFIVWNGKQIAPLVPLSQWHGAANHNACYILASGPSMQAIDLAQLGTVPLFGVNGAIAKFQNYPEFSPQYYVISDPDFIAHRFSLVEAAFARAPHFFMSAAAMSAICEIKPDLLGCAPISLIETHFCPYGKPRLNRQQIADLIKQSPALYARDWRIGFSKDIELGLFSAHTVAYYAIQIACHMKFRNVFLLGMDFQTTPHATRFYEAGTDARPSGVDKDYEKFIQPSFEVLQRVCREDTSFHVYNLSMQSRLPDSLVPKISLTDAIRLSEKALF